MRLLSGITRSSDPNLRAKAKSACFVLGLVFCFDVAPEQPEAATGVPERSAAVEEFWNAYAQTDGGPSVNDYYRVTRFDSDAAISKVLVDFILKGQRTALFRAAWLTEGDRDATSLAGDYVVLTDFDEVPVAVWRTISVKTLPFNEVNESDTALETPIARQLDVWREIHWSGGPKYSD